MTDPFARALRRRLPDADLVMLPPEEPEPPRDPIEPAHAQRNADDAARLVRDQLRRWWPLASPDARRPDTLHQTWSPSRRTGDVTAEAYARVSLDGIDDLPDHVARAARELEAHDCALDGFTAAGQRARLRTETIRIDIAAIDKVGAWEMRVRRDNVRVDDLAHQLLTKTPATQPWAGTGVGSVDT